MQRENNIIYYIDNTHPVTNDNYYAVPHSVYKESLERLHMPVRQGHLKMIKTGDWLYEGFKSLIRNDGILPIEIIAEIHFQKTNECIQYIATLDCEKLNECGYNEPITVLEIIDEIVPYDHNCESLKVTNVTVVETCISVGDAKLKYLV